MLIACIVGIIACLLLISYTVHRHHKVIKGINTTIACKSFPSCDLCGHLIGKYFVDGYGRTVCAGCRPEGYVDAVRRKTAVG